MTEDFERALHQVLEAVAILSPTSFSIAGEPAFEVNPQTAIMPVQQTIGHPLPPNPMVRELQSKLYARFYTREFDPENPEASKHSKQAQPADAQAARAKEQEFTQGLVAANHSRDYWDPMWRVYQISSGGSIQVQKGDRCRSAQAGNYAIQGSNTTASTTPAVGTQVSLKVEAGSFQLQPGFYFVNGETLSDSFDDFATIRFYFHIDAEGAPKLIDLLSRELNRYRVPFRFKTASSAQLYGRTDAAVLYVAKRYFQIVSRVIGSGIAAIEANLGKAAPLFSRKIYDGIGIADEPGNGESFGMNRCRFVAEGIVDAFLQNNQDPAVRVDAVRKRFAMNGLDLDQPHLNPGSADFYALEDLAVVENGDNANR